MKRVMKQRQFSGTKDPLPGRREQEGRILSERAAAEGIVLLKNDGILPLSKGKPLALLGAGAGKTIKGGTGSGDVCERSSVSVYEGMKAAGFTITSGGWIEDYAGRFDRARNDWKQMILKEAGGARTPAFFDVYASHPFSFPEGRPITEADFQGSSTAVYCISRVAGEGADRKNEPGDYQLTEQECRDLRTLKEMGKDVVVLLNIGGLIDLQKVEENPAVKAVLCISQPGMEGGTAAAAVLSGEENPSGKLTDTWARSFGDYPNAKTFSYLDGSVEREEYREGIFTGYRYFDTFEIPVQYCFGFGLSYTSFAIASENLKIDGNTIELLLRITNTGSRPGKEVVQVYASAPDGKLSKEFRRLAGWKKTSLISPGESEMVSVLLNAKDLASFDPETCSWILEKGEYYLLAGSSLADSRPIACLDLEKQVSLEQLHDICPLKEHLEELAGNPSGRRERREELKEECMRNNRIPVQWDPKPEETEVFWDEEEQNLRREAAELAEKLTDEELIRMSVGEISRGHDVALGAAGIMVPGAAGETSGVLEQSCGVPGAAMADGPAGIRVISAYAADEEAHQIYTQGFLGAIEQGFFAEPLEVKENTAVYYQYCTAFPVGTMLAQTWNQDLQREVGRQVGIEMEELGISWWLAPGMNIHRNPLCGRNFEYFSEDPALTGMTAAAITEGVQSVPGTGTTLKHFCCNNQEDNRFGSNSIAGARALREIYLRGFEIAVKKAQPMAVMSSYNLVNGIHTANSRDLLWTVLREEWGFRGFVMTDWTATGRGCIAHLCVKNGNELIMPGSNEDLEELKEALSSGKLTRKELEESVTRLLSVIFRTNAYEEAGEGEAV